MKKLFFIQILIISSFVFINNSNAQGITDLLPDFSLEQSLSQMPGHIKGEGSHFEINDSEYFNIKLNSSEPIKLTLESIPEMVTMNIESSTLMTSTSTQITLAGFNSLTTYYKYEDNYHNSTEFTTDENGNYSYIQDLSQQHLIFIQPRKSTKFIKDNATGGDCYLIGNWDASTKTCTLTKDLNETIQIDNNNIILDGNNHTITGSNTGTGIYFFNKSKIIIKNFNIQNFGNGISLSSSNDIILINNIIMNNNSRGISLISSSNSILDNNFISDNGYGGIMLFSINDTILINNTVNSNIYYGIYIDSSINGTLTNNKIFNNKYNFTLWGFSDLHFDTNNIDISNTVDNKPIYYVKNVINQVYNSLTNAGVFYCINCDNVIVKELTLNNNGYGIFFWKTKNSTIENVTVSNNNLGMYYYSSNNNTLNNNIISNNDSGTYFRFSYDNFITNNIINNSIYNGIILYFSNNNILSKNNILNNGRYGIDFSGAINNKVYNNNFINNLMQIYIRNGNMFNLDLPIGGNYWSNYDELGEGCYDNNFDNICDSSYIFSGGQDNFPWKIKDGWLLSQQPPQMINPTDSGKLKEEFNPSINHYGIDIDKTLYQKPVKSPANGTIIKIDFIDDSKAGKWVWIYHGSITKKNESVVEKISTRYLHMDTIDSAMYVGKQVAQGEIIGKVGTTGYSTAPHLHFEVRQGNIPLNLDYRLTTALDPLHFITYTKPAFSVSAYSPIDIIVTDPDGLILSKVKNDFGDGADYFELMESDEDDGADVVEYEIASIDQIKNGDYLINVIPEPGALPEDTFTLKANICGTDTILSENTLVNYIPNSPYIVNLNGCSFEKFIPIKIITQALNAEYTLGSQLQIQFSAIDNIFGTNSIFAALNDKIVNNNDIVILDKPGINVLTITAVDNSGYSTIITKTFNVIYNFGGFLPPIKTDGSGVYNLGRTLPVKFQLTDINGNFISTALAHLYIAKISDGVIGDDEIPRSVSLANIGNQFRYDFTNNQYIYNLSTDTPGVGSWRLKAILDSGQIYTAIISIK